jgi:3-oxoacyl-[acyl-carrier-protein] synthase II
VEEGPCALMRMNIQQRRVVVTGVGLVSPVGVGTEVTWKALLQGESGIGPISLFDSTGFSCRIAGEVKNFSPEDFIERKEIKKMGRFIQFAQSSRLRNPAWTWPRKMRKRSGST